MFKSLPLNIKLLIIITIFVILILPQLNNVHYDPLPQYWAEVTSGCAAIFLFLIVCFSNREMVIPRITLPLLLFTVYLAIQPQLIHISFPGLSYITSLELFVGILLAIAIATIINNYGLAQTITFISQALVTGAVIQSAIGFLQYTGHYNLFGDFIFYDPSHPTTNIFGHFGQRNHYCHYLSWATFGLIYLYLNNKIQRSNFYTLLLWIMFSMTIASSRSVFIYFALATLISAIYFVAKRDLLSRRLFLLIIISSAILFIFELGYPILQHILTTHPQIQSGLQRLDNVASDNGTGRRIIEWQKAWITFKEYPVFGMGLNQFSHQSVYLQPLFKHTPANSGLFTNCHNLILQLLAETGIIGALIIIVGLIWVIYNICKQAQLETVIILCMIATTISHSMVEYPLWYTYFLYPFIMFLCIDKPLIKINSNVIAGITTIPLVLTVYLLITGSVLFNNLVNYTDAPSNKQQFIAQVKYLEKVINNNVLWAYPAIYTLDDYINVDTANTNAAFSLNEQISYESQLTYLRPYPDSLMKLAMLYWNNSDKKTAMNYAVMAIEAFPVYKSTFLNTLKNKKYKPLYDIVNNYKE